MALMEHDIKFEVIPGVTSAIGAPTSLGLPVTHRALATSVTIVTGHEDPTKPESQVHWDYTADTLIILMGIGNIKENTSEIMRYRSADTPVCVVENGTLANENLLFGTLEDISDKKINNENIDEEIKYDDLRRQGGPDRAMPEPFHRRPRRPCPL